METSVGSSMDESIGKSAGSSTGKSMENLCIIDGKICGLISGRIYEKIYD